MNNDIFDLKLGREIYQVDYNHENGKFTEKQLINPANNLIVCGLHSLYDKNSTFVYDLKIFMDTDENLKMKWKIKRDIKERGYTIDKILDSIKKRKFDFDTYILPQKENADIIIRFFTDDVIDFNNLETKELIKLDLYDKCVDILIKHSPI
jgi:phosphoribulokinase